MLDRFWAKVDQADDCWEWQGSRQTGGYGRFRPIPSGKWFLAHRIAWELANARSAEGLFVCHHCDNRSCCHPDHLFLGTPGDNVRDMKSKGRHAHGFRLPFTRTTDRQRQEIVDRYQARIFPGRNGRLRSNAVELAAEYGIGRGYVMILVQQARKDGHGEQAQEDRHGG